MSKKPLLDSGGRRKLTVLTRRANFLQASISTTDEELRGRSYNRAELAALEFAIETIREHYQPTDHHGA